MQHAGTTSQQSLDLQDAITISDEEDEGALQVKLNSLVNQLGQQLGPSMNEVDQFGMRSNTKKIWRPLSDQIRECQVDMTDRLRWVHLLESMELLHESLPIRHQFQSSLGIDVLIIYGTLLNHAV